jgi:hypothetical protein
MCTEQCGFDRQASWKDNGSVPGASRVQVVFGAVLAPIVGFQMVASCGLWLMLAAPPCCPSPDAHSSQPALAPACCSAVDQDVVVVDTWIGTLKAAQPRLQQPFLVMPLDVDLRAGYRATLPVAARGHTLVSLSALLI